MKSASFSKTALVILALALGTSQAEYQPYAFAEGERDFRVEWEQR